MTRVVSIVFALILASTVAFAKDVKPHACPIVPNGQKSTEAAKAKVGLLDINTASEAELKAMPGVGDTYAKKIIAGRPYAKKDQLKTKKIIPASVYDKIKDKIVASQIKK